jgi:hypothetical protein
MLHGKGVAKGQSFPLASIHLHSELDLTGASEHFKNAYSIF